MPAAIIASPRTNAVSDTSPSAVSFMRLPVPLPEPLIIFNVKILANNLLSKNKAVPLCHSIQILFINMVKSPTRESRAFFLLVPCDCACATHLSVLNSWEIVC